MRFSKKYVIHDKEKRAPLVHGTWSPRTRDYKDIIEDYLASSRKRIYNKAAMLNLQIHLFQDLVAHQKILDGYNIHLKNEENSSDKERANFIKSEIFVHELFIRNLKDISDGIVCRYFKHSRGLLYYMADKPQVGPPRMDQGHLHELDQWAYENDASENHALLNSLTNILKIGDITVFSKDGDIEFIEVKSGSSRRGKGHKARLSRQTDKIIETVKFFNTGITSLDGEELRIINIPLQPQYRFDLLVNLIQETKLKGVSCGLINDYLLVECVDFENTDTNYIELLEQNRRPIIEKWKAANDKVLGPNFLFERLDFSKNLVPFSVWPFDCELCADLMAGRIMVGITFNISEFLRKIISDGWVVNKNIFDMNEKQIKKETMAYLIRLEKKGFYIEVPPGLFGRVIYEFLTVETILNGFNWLHSNTPESRKGNVLMEYEGERAIWS